MTDIPRILGRRYEIGDLIGRGGMAQVHLGYDTRLSRTVAIKVLRTDLAADPMFLARFRREAQSAAALNHPSIVAVYDTGEEDLTTATGVKISLPYIVMEYVRGRTVASLLSTGEPLPINEAVQVVSGVLSALEYSHHEGIIHRDIKPGNVMLTPDGKVKVMDFGIARAVADSQATMTQTNSVVGTAQYLSPEQARGEVVDARSDLYSTGCLLYELLTGKPPFTGDSAVSVAYQHVSEAPTPASAVFSDIPEAIDRVVMKSLAKLREERYQTAGEFRTDLLAAARGASVSAPAVGAAGATRVLTQPTQIVPRTMANAPVPPAPAPRVPATQTTVVSPTSTGIPAVNAESEKKSKRRVIVACLVAALVVAAGGLGWALTHRGGDTPEPTPSTTTAQMVKIPDLTGLNETQVTSQLKAANLTFVRGTDQASDTVEKGHYVSSDPAVGTSVAEGSKVTVHFSSGPASVQVPNVIGKTTSEARTLLEAEGLKVGDISTTDSAAAKKDRVVEASPTVGSAVESGSTVSIVISSGYVPMPNLVNKSIDKATTELNELNLKVNQVSKAVTDPALDGVVTAQDMTAGTKVEQDSFVTLTVGRYIVEPTSQPTSSSSSTPEPSSTTGK